MGKWIDRIVLWTLIAASIFCLFLYAFKSPVPAAVFSYFCCALLYRKRRGRKPKYRMTSMEARSLLEKWAYSDDADARHTLEMLTGRTGSLVYIPKHPSGALSVSDVFSVWKANRKQASILIACPCRAESRSKTFARTLAEPSVEIADDAKLVQLIRRSDLRPPDVRRAKYIWNRLRLAFASLPSQRSWKKSVLSGMLLMPVYLLTGVPGYLFLSIGMLFLAGVSLKVQLHH